MLGDHPRRVMDSKACLLAGNRPSVLNLLVTDGQAQFLLQGPDIGPRAVRLSSNPAMTSGGVERPLLGPVVELSDRMRMTGFRREQTFERCCGTAFTGRVLPKVNAASWDLIDIPSRGVEGQLPVRSRGPDVRRYHRWKTVRSYSVIVSS